MALAAQRFSAMEDGSRPLHSLEKRWNMADCLARAACRGAADGGARNTGKCGDYRLTIGQSADAKKGFDAGKKVKGIKRHFLVDTLGFPLKMIVHDASVQDRDGAKVLLKNIKKTNKKLKVFWADGGYRGPIMQEVARQEKLKIEIVKRGEEKCFKVLPKRWIVERSFAWLEPARRLAKHYENLDDTQLAMMQLRFIQIAINRIIKLNC